MMMKLTNLLGILIFLLLSCSKTPTIDYSGFEAAEHLNAKVEGFEIQTIAEGTGEWLSIATDPQGRLLVSPRNGELLRFTIKNDGSGDLKIDTLRVGVRDCQGLLYAYNSLYMMGTGPNKVRGIYRLKDENGTYSQPTLLKEFAVNGDHSGHTLTLGQDGMIYFLTGNNNRPPMDENVDFVNKNWHLDHPLPLTSIYGNDQFEPGGFVLRTDSLGKEWQFVSYGLRNPYDMCFSPEGELFTFDSDMEWDFNLPWYRATRVNHLVSGADFAWRQIDGKRFDYFPDVWPAVGEVGRGSPTATTFGTNAAFPAKYQKALFLGDWSYGKIYTMVLEPTGSTYQADYETFASGQPLNITDMIVGQDGAMYFVTGGNGTDTGLFRIVYNGKESTKKVKPAPSDANAKLRTIRKKIEKHHFEKDTTGLGLALSYVGHEDRFIRNSARVILERNEPDLWKAELNDPNNFEAKITLLTALIRTDTAHLHQDLIFETLESDDFTTLSNEEQLSILRLTTLAFLRGKAITIEKYNQHYDRLLTAYPSKEEIVNKELSRVLGYLAVNRGEGSAAIAKTFDLIESTKNPQLFIHYLTAIRKIPTGWTLEQRLAFQHWIQFGIDNLSGGSLFTYFLGQIREEFEATWTPIEKGLLANKTPQPIKEGYEGPVRPKPKRTATALSKRQAIYNWKYEDLEYNLELVTSPREQNTRDFNRGYRLFQEGQCADCHSMLQRGGNFGPELTVAGNSFSADDLLVAILEPSKDISSRFQETDFKLKNGETLWGRLINETGDSYVIQQGQNPANTKTIPKKEVASKSPSTLSGMPPGLLNTMGKEEIMDLLYFIIEVAPKGQDSLEIDIVEDKTIFEKGDSSLVEILNYAKRGKVYYTIDGSVPTESSPIYEGPFFVTKSTFIRALVIDGTERSQIKGRSIHAVDADKNGLKWQLFTNTKDAFTNLNGKKPSDEGIAYTLSIQDVVQDENTFTVIFNGKIQIEKSGRYTFHVTQNDKAKLWINNRVVVDAPKGWSRYEAASVQLQAGTYPIKVEFYDNMASENLRIEYESADLPRQEIPGDKLIQ